MTAGALPATRKRWMAARVVVAGLFSALAAACGTDAPPEADPAPATPGASETMVACTDSLPDLSPVGEAVQEQIRQRHATLLGLIAEGDASEPLLAESHGGLGMIFMASWFPEAAEPCLLRAAELAPDDVRWPYYLAHVHRDRGNLEQAFAYFQEADQLRPRDLATLVWLGNIRLTQGRPGEARTFFEQALEAQPESLSARFGLGEVALAEEDFDQAVERLEEIRSLNPDIGAVHYPLGMAYRGLGNEEKAEEHLTLRENAEIQPGDPLLEALDAMLDSPGAFERRGLEALEQQDLTVAVEEFQRGLELDPDNPSLRHQLGTALFMMGDPAGAMTEFQRVVRTTPDYYPSYYGMGVVLQEIGRHDEAIRAFTTAYEARPDDVAVRVRLAQSLRQTGDPAASLGHYDAVLAIDPAVIDARFGQAMAHVQLGQYSRAKDLFEAAMLEFPEELGFPHALARILAAAPDAAVRNGRRALVLVEALAPTAQTLDLGETMAMTLAELGQYEDAAGIQQELVGVAESAALPEPIVRRLRDNLDLYLRGEPCRTPWAADAMP